MKRILQITLCVLMIGTSIFAQSHLPRAVSKPGVKRSSVSSCANSPTLIPDGTTSGVEDSIGPNAVAYYFENLQDGHSYSAEVWDPFDSVNGTVPTLSLFDNSCTNLQTYTDVSAVTPDLSSAYADRISWIQAGTISEQIQMFNPDTANTYSFYIRITDTTLYNPRWSTFSGFITQYAFVNKTNTDITGTLTLTDTSQTVFSTSITIPAGREVLQSVPSSNLTVPLNDFGFATFAFVGPAGAIVADAYFLNSNASVVVPSTFGPVGQH